MSLLEFYGESCPHCINMKPIVENLERALNVKVEKYEVWNDEENAKKMEKYDTGLCGGVPFFYNTESKKFICGACTADELEKWVKGL